MVALTDCGQITGQVTSFLGPQGQALDLHFCPLLLPCDKSMSQRPILQLLQTSLTDWPTCLCF